MWESGKSSARGAERSLFSPLMLPAGRQAQPNNRSQSFGSPEYQTKKKLLFQTGRAHGLTWLLLVTETDFKHELWSKDNINDQWWTPGRSTMSCFIYWRSFWERAVTELFQTWGEILLWLSLLLLKKSKKSLLRLLLTEKWLQFAKCSSRISWRVSSWLYVTGLSSCRSVNVLLQTETLADHFWSREDIFVHVMVCYWEHFCFI